MKYTPNWIDWEFMGRTGPKEDGNWIGTEEPFYAAALLAAFFIPIIVLMLTGLVLSLHGIYIEGTSMRAQSNWIFLFEIFAFPGIIGGIITVLVYIDTITSISMDERKISLRFATGKVKRIPWSRVCEMEICGEKGNHVSIKIREDSIRDFTLGNIDGLARTYARATGREPNRMVFNALNIK